MEIAVIWTIKLILDCFYMYSWQDYAVMVLMLMALMVACCKVAKERSVKRLCYEKTAVISIVCLMTISALIVYNFFKLPSFISLKNGGAAITHFVLYFSTYIISNKRKDYFKNFINTIIFTYQILYIINMATCISGCGRQIWQGNTVLKGLYYYKSDLAIFILQYTIVLAIYMAQDERLKLKKNRIFMGCMLLLNGIWLLLINSRMTTLIYGLISPVLYLYLFKDKSREKTSRWVFSSVYICVLSTTATFFSIFFFAHVSNTIGRYFIWDTDSTSTHFSNINDFTSKDIEYNVLGFTLDQDNFWEVNSNAKTEVFLLIMNYWEENLTISQKLFGLDLQTVDDDELHPPHKIGSCHNMYLQILFFSGVLGLAVFLIWIVFIGYTCVNSRSLYAVPTGLITAVMMIHGMSKLMFTETQNTWFVMIFIALFFNEYNLESDKS